MTAFYIFSLCVLLIFAIRPQLLMTLYTIYSEIRKTRRLEKAGRASLEAEKKEFKFVCYGKASQSGTYGPIYLDFDNGFRKVLTWTSDEFRRGDKLALYKNGLGKQEIRLASIDRREEKE